MKNRVIKAEIIHNKIIRGRLQILTIKLSDESVYKEYYLSALNKIEIAENNTRFNVGKFIKVEMNEERNIHFQRNYKKGLSANVKRIII